MINYRQLGDDAHVQQYEYGDEQVIVADLGFVDGSVDIVDNTAIIVTEADQYELSLPDAEAHASMNNGVVTIEVKI